MDLIESGEWKVESGVAPQYEDFTAKTHIFKNRYNYTNQILNRLTEKEGGAPLHAWGALPPVVAKGVSKGETSDGFPLGVLCLLSHMGK